MLKKNKTWMIRIDQLSFEFGAPDERFAQNLYADWDSFCHRCFERVVEECLAPYGDDQILHELEQLNLDLGSIPEDDFYDEFPRRLKEALRNALPSLHELQAQADPQKTTAFRTNNLLFLLKYGYPLPEWTDTNFQPQKEIELLTESSDTFYDTFIRKTALLCLRQEHALRRLAEQTGQEKTLLDIYATALAEPSAGQTEKRRLLTLLLEIKPDIPICFVHETSDTSRLQEMSDLLDTLSVRQLIRTETKEHAEVDLPPYWHYLYEWLIKYYPYNGIAIFGNKTEFTRHLHYRLLTYINKRDGTPYLSKAELTTGFLLEVFGPTYYKEMLNTIYLFQPHNPDGSPVYDHYFNRELYRIFLQLSLLRLPETAKGNPNTDEGDEITDKAMTTTQDLLESMAKVNFYQAATGKEQDATDTRQWQQLAETITADETDHTAERSSKKLLQTLTNPSVSRIALQESLAHLIDKHPEKLLAWLEQEAGSNEIIRMAEATDRMQITHWTDCLVLTPGFAHAGVFRQLIDWLLQRIPAGEVATVLFLYVKEPGWKTFTPEQTETYFFSRLYGQTDVLSPVETLTDKNLPEAIRKRLFYRYLRHQPEKLLTFIREAFSRHILLPDEWLQKTDTSDWLYLAASFSLAKAELLRQITDSLSLPEEERKKALVTYLLHSDTKEWPYLTPQETIRDFFNVMPSMQHVATEKKKEAIRQVENKLNLPETEIPFPEEQPEILMVNNAGLCLLAPWFVRLFAMLGYLDEEGKQFRNTASKVRAVFLLQYLTCGEEKSWRETELAFNRLLTALPGHVPLPKHLALTDEERQTADSMMAGVKANWPQMNGTSVEGFRGSFLVRKGKLEQEEERWLLTVEEKAYDILLETIPWSFRQIRLPWLKKYVQVKWHEKQIF